MEDLRHRLAREHRERLVRWGIIAATPRPKPTSRSEPPAPPPPPMPPPRIRIPTVLAATAAAFQLKPDDITGDRRFAHITLARHVAFYLARVLTPNSTLEIGRRCGGKDHTTILHGARRVRRLIDHDQQLAKQVADITACIAEVYAQRVD